MKLARILALPLMLLVALTLSTLRPAVSQPSQCPAMKAEARTDDGCKKSDKAAAKDCCKKSEKAAAKDCCKKSEKTGACTRHGSKMDAKAGACTRHPSKDDACCKGAKATH